MKKTNSIEQRLRIIEDRNKKVELDKEWETSAARRVLLTFFTYISVGLYLQIINIEKPWINAIVPAIGFMLSTLTMPFFKKMWIDAKNKK